MPETKPLKQGEVMKTFGRLGTWVKRQMVLTEGYLEYNSGWYHRHSVSAKKRRIYFGDVEWIREDVTDPEIFVISCRGRDKPYMFKGKNWFAAIAFALRDFRAFYMPPKTRTSGPRCDQNLQAETDGGDDDATAVKTTDEDDGKKNRSFISEGVRSAARKSQARIDLEGNIAVD